MNKRRVSGAVAKYFMNPVMRVLGGRIPGWAVLETIGRKSGVPRRNPVGDGLDGDTFWIVSEHGRSGSYVRNIEANPRVRVRIRGRWRTGTAHLMPEDDARERQRRIGRKNGVLARVNGAFVRLMGTDLVTVRVDLDRADGEPGDIRQRTGSDGSIDGG